MGGPVQVIANTEEWKAALANKEGLACIVDFFADWCGPCKMIAPHFVKLAEENAGKALFLKVNVDDNEEIAQLCGISAMPTFQVWKDGAQVDTILGANLDKLNQLVTKHTAMAVPA